MRQRVTESDLCEVYAEARRASPKIGGIDGPTVLLDDLQPVGSSPASTAGIPCLNEQNGLREPASGSALGWSSIASSTHDLKL